MRHIFVSEHQFWGELRELTFITGIKINRHKVKHILRYVRHIVVYYESVKRELKTKTIYGFRCDERLKTKVEESTRLACTLFCAELEHLKIETRLNWVEWVSIQ